MARTRGTMAAEAAEAAKLSAKVQKLEEQLNKERERSRDNLRKLMNAVKERDEAASAAKAREAAAQECDVLRQQLEAAQLQVTHWLTV